MKVDGGYIGSDADGSESAQTYESIHTNWFIHLCKLVHSSARVDSGWCRKVSTFKVHHRN
jgi:hypothetical protein